MASEGKSQSKSEFLRELFRTRPEASEKDAVAAWQQAGNEGTISSSAFYTAKRAAVGKAEDSSSAARKPKAKSARSASEESRADDAIQASAPEPAAAADAPEPARSGGDGDGQDRGRTLDSVEGRIDDLIFTLKEMGGVPEVEEALRAARRLLYRS